MKSRSIAQTQKPGTTWLWFAYTGFFLIDPIVQPSVGLWVKTLAALVVFLVIFSVYIHATRETTRRWMIAATFVLGLVCLPWNSGASTFFIYAAAFLPFSFASTPLVLALFGVEALGAFAEGRFFHVSWVAVAMSIFLLLIIGCGNIAFSREHRANCRLRAAQEENIALAALAERERIARDLHDVLGHTLSLIVLKAELAGRLLEHDAAGAEAEIADVERTARSALAEVREAIVGYRSRGLAAEIEAARQALDAAGVILISDAATAETPGLNAAEETVLALALREAVTNIVRHAKAKTCRLRFLSESGVRRLLVEDDGEHPLAREGNGLRGMRERVEALGGNVSLERDGGTRLLIELPSRAGVATS